jgi:hypothetical protein
VILGLTVIIFVVAPFDQVILPLLQLPVKLVDVPLQIMAGLPELNAMLGADGMGLTIKLTVALLDGKVSQLLFESLQPT